MSLSTKPIAVPKPSEPAFLKQRIGTYFENRLQNEWGGRHIFNGLSPKPGDVVVTSNDYLSISNHPEIVKAQVDSLMSIGNGMVMSAIFMREDDPLYGLQAEFAKFLHAENVLVAQSGFVANTGLIQSIAKPGIPVYLDLKAHMSLWEGANSACAKAIPFAHNDPNNLERWLKRHGSGVICVDALYSTTGELCPLSDIAWLAERYDCVLIVDESHSLGTHGPKGAGLVVEYGLEDKVHFRTSSLAKAFAGRGGLVIGSAAHTEFFCYESRPAIFSSAVLPHDIVGFKAALHVIAQEEWRRTKVHHNADYVRNGLLDLGYNLNNSASQIVSLETGSECNTMKVRDALERRGLFGSIFCAPATPKNCAMIRMSLCADLNQQQLDHIISACKDIRDEVDMWNWPSTLRTS